MVCGAGTLPSASVSTIPSIMKSKSPAFSLLAVTESILWPRRRRWWTRSSMSINGLSPCTKSDSNCWELVADLVWKSENGQ